MKINIKKLIITIAIMLAASFGIMCLRGVFSAADASDVLRIMSDGCFATGLIVLGLAGLMWLANDGTFDALGFVTKTFFSLKWSVFGDFKEHYIDYKERKKVNISIIEFVISGVSGIILAVIFLIVRNAL